MYRRKALKLFIFKAAQANTTVTDEVMSTAVLNVPIGMFNSPVGHAPATVGHCPIGAWTRRRMYDENSAPNNMISEARNNQIPTFAL
jgi:hypothetical protein